MPNIGEVGPITPSQKTPSEVYGGNMAMTTQDYLSLNCKLGTQWESSLYIPALAAGANVDFVVITGALPVLVKARTIEVDGLGVVVNVYRDPVYTGGTPKQVFNLNSGVDTEVVQPLAQLLGGVSVSDPGVPIAAERRVLGSSTLGNNRLATQGGEYTGLERVLLPNSVFLFRSTSTDPTNPQKYNSYSTFYEGPLDVPYIL